MDDFGKINKEFGQDAGDVVMKDYLEVMQDSLSLLGTDIEILGDETVAIVGQEREQVCQIAETIRKKYRIIVVVIKINRYQPLRRALA